MLSFKRIPLKTFAFKNCGEEVFPARVGRKWVGRVPNLLREALEKLAFPPHIPAQKLSFLPLFGAMPKSNNLRYRSLRLFCGVCHKTLAEVLGQERLNFYFFSSPYFRSGVDFLTHFPDLQQLIKNALDTEEQRRLFSTHGIENMLYSKLTIVGFYPTTTFTTSLS